jgi:hypothetical protein
MAKPGIRVATFAGPGAQPKIEMVPCRMFRRRRRGRRRAHIEIAGEAAFNSLTGQASMKTR